MRRLLNKSNERETEHIYFIALLKRRKRTLSCSYNQSTTLTGGNKRAELNSINYANMDIRRDV